MEWHITLYLMLGTLIGLTLLGFPLAACLGLTGFIFMAIGVGPRLAGVALSGMVFDMWTGYYMLAIPLFIVMAEFLFVGGISEGLYDMASKWLSRLPGGLALATIAACAIYGAMSGVTVAAVATFGVVAIPQMLKKGYSKRLACGAVTSAGNLAHLIPPSVLAIVYASLVETSPGKQQMAGLMPGLLLAVGFAIVTVIWVLRNPTAAPREPDVSWRERWLSLRHVIIPFVIVIVVLGGMYSGATTVTEAAALGAFAAFVFALSARRLTWSITMETLLKVVKTSAFILLIAVSGKFFGWVLNYYTVPQQIVRILTDTQWNGWVILAIVQVLYIIMGMFIDPMGIMFTTVPILQPVMTAFGFDMIWFGVLFLVNMELANVTPPLGLALFVTKGIVGDQVELSDIIWGSLYFCTATVAVLALVMGFPSIALWIPSTMQR